MPNYWIIKSEPFKYSFEQLKKDKKTIWDGVRNYEARRHIRQMQKGDKALFYHSNDGKEIVGISSITSLAFQDPTSGEDWSCIEVSYERAFKHPISLAFLKNHAQLSKIALVTRPRLSVIPLSQTDFDCIVELSNYPQALYQS